MIHARAATQKSNIASETLLTMLPSTNPLDLFSFLITTLMLTPF